MKIVFLIGNRPNHIALAQKISEIVKPELIVTETRSSVERNVSKNLIRKVVALLSYPIHSTWFDLQKHYRDHYSLPKDVPVLNVGNVNASDVLQTIVAMNADYIFVSGTRLIKKEVVQALEKHSKIINLHTGLSPYIKGGPNCTNWCLALNKPYLIGNSIMWLNAGIDSGNLITTQKVELSNIKSFYDLHLRVMEHAHELFCAVANSLALGKELPNRLQMQINQGKTFYTKDWTLWQQIRCIVNFYLIFKVKKSIKKPKQLVVEVKLLS